MLAMRSFGVVILSLRVQTHSSISDAGSVELKNVSEFQSRYLGEDTSYHHNTRFEQLTLSRVVGEIITELTDELMYSGARS